MSAVIDASADQVRRVRGILARHAGVTTRAWVFGSRVQGRARPFSDLDLAIEAGRPLSLSDLAAIEDEFEESDLPWRVDLVDLNAVSEAFRRRIEGQALQIYPAP